MPLPPHPEYTALNSGAHRKPPVKLGAPGLCRQINYWIATDPRDEKGGISLDHPVMNESTGEELYSFRSRRRLWIFYVDHFIRNIFDNIMNIDPHFKDDLRLNTFNAYHDTGNGRFDSVYFFRHAYAFATTEGRTLRPIFDDRETPIVDTPFKNTTFDSLIDLESKDIPGRFETVYLRFMWDDVPVKLQFILHNEYFTFGTYIDLLSSPSETLSSPQYQEISQHLSDINMVCNSRYHAIRNPGRPDWGLQTSSDRQELAKAHEFLYDKIWSELDNILLRNALFCHSDTSANGESLALRIGFKVFDARGVLLHCPPDDETTVSPAFHIQKQHRHPLHEHIAFDTPDEKQIFNDLSAVQHADALLPFINAPAPAEDARIEYTATRFLRKRVIYLSSLAAEHIGPTKGEAPVKFLLLCRPFHRWQLGRLVDRLFAIGSVRVAALMNIGILNSTGDDLRQLTRDLQAAQVQVDDEATLASLVQKSNSIREATTALGKRCDGGFEYRIERSRYYVQQYHEIEETMSMDMVEGFQQYDIFVRRKLFSSYEFINRLGIRVERHKRDLELFAQHIRVQQNRVSNEARRIIQGRMLGIQILGEIIAVFPLTYYTTNVLVEISIIEKGDRMSYFIVGVAYTGVFILAHFKEWLSSSHFWANWRGLHRRRQVQRS